MAAASSNRSSPFILVALLVLVGILTYNYWSLAKQRENLLNTIYSINIKSKKWEIRELDAARIISAMTLELAGSKNKLTDLGNREKEKSQSLEKIKTDFNKINADVGVCKKSLADCEGNLKTKTNEIETLRAELENARKALEEEKQQKKVCNEEDCLVPMKHIVQVAASVIHPAMLKRALIDAKLDPDILLEGMSAKELAQKA